MLYQLSTGRVVDIPLTMYLSMSDEEFDLECQELRAYDYGSDYDIWHHSVLKYKEKPIKEEDFQEEPPIPDLTELDSLDKLKDLDLPEMD